MKLAVRTVVVATAILLGSFSLTACSDFTLDDESKKEASSALCTMSETYVQQLYSGGDLAKVAAKAIAQNTENVEIRKVAQRVAQGLDEAGDREELAQYVKDKCENV